MSILWEPAGIRNELQPLESDPPAENASEQRLFQKYVIASLFPNRPGSGNAGLRH